MRTLIADAIENPTLVSGIRGDTGATFFGKLLPAMVQVVLVIGAVVFFFMLLVGGIGWMTAGGDKQALETARSRVAHAIIGAVILFSVFALTRAIEDIFGVTILQITLPTL